MTLNKLTNIKKNNVAEPGFKPELVDSEGERANHYTMAA